MLENGELVQVHGRCARGLTLASAAAARNSHPPPSPLWLSPTKLQGLAGKVSDILEKLKAEEEKIDFT